MIVSTMSITYNHDHNFHLVLSKGGTSAPSNSYKLSNKVWLMVPSNRYSVSTVCTFYIFMWHMHTVVQRQILRYEVTSIEI